MSWALVGLRARLLAVLFVPEQLRLFEERFVLRLQTALDALTFLRNEVRCAVNGPALASITVLCERNVGRESAHAAYGGTKFGEFEGTCHLGNMIRVRLEFLKGGQP